tara:strand:- start:348 stop:551 length:204 start_codon:yes stop_codon:yes gene_type:complete
MTKFIKVKDHPYLYRDRDTGAIINRDNIAYEKRMRKIESDKMKKEEIENLKNEIEELKSLVNQILNK